MATILIAEDEIRIATFVAKGLHQAGYTTHIATNGHQALALAAQCDLILLDIGLPDIDGWAVLEKLRAQSPQPPIIVVTALDNLEERHRSLALGANEFVPKPFRFSHLLTCIRRYV